MMMKLIAFLGAVSGVAASDATLAEIQASTQAEGGSSSDCWPSNKLGHMVTVSGVTVTGVDAYGFYVQDTSVDKWGGLFVYTAGGGDQHLTVATGDTLDLEGEVVEYYGLTELYRPDTVTAVSSGTAVDPVVVTTGMLGEGCNAEDSDIGEPYEGMYITIAGPITVLSDRNNYGEVTIDDGSGPTQLDDSIFVWHLEGYEDLGAGAVIEGSLSGVVKYAYGSYEIHPTSADDIVVTAAGPPPPPPWLPGACSNDCNFAFDDVCDIVVTARLLSMTSAILGRIAMTAATATWMSRARLSETSSTGSWTGSTVRSSSTTSSRMQTSCCGFVTGPGASFLGERARTEPRLES